MTYLTIDEVHAALLEILDEFDRVCRENGLRYTLSYGTLLGAVRHKGFIPWDDDVDVSMPRPDYERLYAMVKDGTIRFGEHFLLSEDRGKKADYPFLKLMDDRYAIKSSSHIEVPYLSLDIFPIDGVPDVSPKQRKKLFHKELFCNFVVLMTRWYTFSEKWWGYVLRPFMFWFYLIWICYGKDRAMRRLNKLLTKYPFEECALCDNRAWGARIADVPKTFYDDLIELEFEGHRFFGFAEYDTFLTSRYGDYMTPPPKNKRHTHCIKVYRPNGENK